ncbi:MAG: tetratricopeptide repeat protein [Alphaproteobacteria bacterium]|nr:tetratricopeptide repeat protein [Alphaproteobacteria bacterium]
MPVGPRPLLVLVALLASGTAFGQAADRVEGPVPEEIAAFKAASERFRMRATEMREDTREYVAYREQLERTKLTAGYETILENLQELERNQRDLAIRRFESFLDKHPSTPYSSHVRFRLADLYFEVENERWLERSKLYFERLNATDLTLEEAEQLESEGEPRLDLSNAVALYKRIIADNEGKSEEDRYERLDGVYLMLGFVYAEENAALPEADYPEENASGEPFDPASFEDVAQRKSELAKKTFRQLIAKMPDSELADRAHLFLGNFLFDEGEFDQAIAEYQFVYERGEEGPYYDEAIYQLAWANYKTDIYEDAIPLFTQVLDRSETLKADTGKDSPFRTDAVRYMAFAFADEGTTAEGGALGVAKRYFAETGERPYEWDVYGELADGLTRYGRWEEAVYVFRHLQDDPRWRNRPENPEFQMQIVRIYGNPVMLDDLEKSGEARLLLTSRYNEGTEWWEANRNNPDALAVARGFIESSLGQVAQELRVRAQESGEPEDYLVAAEKYQEYLDKFPISDDYYQVQWLLADSLRLGGDDEGALREYNSLIKSADYHEFLDGALVFRLQIHFQDLLKNAPPEILPEGSEVERTYTTEAKKEITVYKLGGLQQAFIESADSVLTHEFSEPAAGVPDFRPFVEDNRHALTYLPGQILHTHNRYEESRPRLEKVIKEFPRKDEASYAASLLVDSFVNEGDLASVRLYTNRFSTMVLGTADVPDPEGKFRSQLESTAFLQAQALAESEDSLAAAEAFMQFLQDFPDSEHKEYSLYNAAFYYQQAGRAEKANSLYEEFLSKYPNHEWSEKLYDRVAALYASTLQLGRAVEYYENLARRFPDSEKAPDALYNAAFLKVGLGKTREAAQGLEAYGVKYDDRPDAEKVFFSAGEQWEAVSERDALKFYDRYLAKFDYENPDNALSAMGRKAAIFQAQGNTRAYEKQLDDIESAFDRIAGQGVKLGPNAHEWAARAGVRALEKEFEDLKKGQITRNEDQIQKLLEEKEKAAPALAAKALAFSQKYDNYEYATRALYINAMAPLVFADFGLAIKPPTGLSEDEEFAYWDILEEKVFPIYRGHEAEGVKRLTNLINAAKTAKRHSEAIELAYKELNKRVPSDFPDLKYEIQGDTESSAPPPLSSVRVRVRTEGEEQ